jgi:hypothetical protein
MLIKNDKDFSIVVQNCIAPIYFFDQKNPPSKGEKLTSHGTVTLFKKDNKVYGITNNHVYEDYANKKESNRDTVCQIGYKCIINLENRILYENTNHDLIIFLLHSDDLQKMSNTKYQKTGFTVLDDRVEEYLQYQNLNNCETWPLHVAGYPTTFHEVDQISNTEYNSDFGIFSSYGFASSYVEKISLNISKTRENTEIIIPSLPFPEKNINFGGISGAPVFARTVSNTFGLSLLGIAYEGISLDISCELINAKPISLIQDILLSF